MQKPVQLVPIPPPPPEQRVARGARFAAEGEKRDRHHLPELCDTTSPVGYRRRLSLSRAEGQAALALLSLERPLAFVPGPAPIEQELFEEASLGLLSARQSTNFRGHRQITLGPADSARAAALLQKMEGLEAPVLDGASLTHVGLSRPYRTLFTWFLTFVGHKPLMSLGTVPARAWRKKQQGGVDIPSISWLQHLHVGIWADAMERAALLASGGRRRANVFFGPFSGAETRARNAIPLTGLEALIGLTPAEKAQGWQIALVGQVGTVEGPPLLDPALCRKIGANLLAFRSERIQPGINTDDRAPACYRTRQDTDIPDALATEIGRASINAMAHWTGLSRPAARELLLLERVDVLTEQGKLRVRELRNELAEITDHVVKGLPLWADLPTGRQLSKSATAAKRAFALAGQRIYIGGVDPADAAAHGLSTERAVRAIGAAAARAALTTEITGCTEIPEGCDTLAGICMMAGPVNQNDIGKQFYGYKDLLHPAYPHKEPTSLLVITMKAKTVTDPIGNEQQLMDPRQKGSLVDLRPGPHEVVDLLIEGNRQPMRSRAGRLNAERAFGDQDNFVADPDGREIPGNRGAPWPRAWRTEAPWPSP